MTNVRTILIILMARRGEHPVGTKTVTGEKDEVNAAVLVQTDLFMQNTQFPHPDDALPHTECPSIPISAQVFSRVCILTCRTTAEWRAVPQTVVRRVRRLLEVVSAKDCQSPRRELALMTGFGLDIDGSPCINSICMCVL